MEIKLKIPSAAEYLKLIDKFFQQYAEIEQYGAKEIHDMCMALEEACSNIIKHAYNLKKDKYYSIILKSSKERMTIILEDEGKSFDIEKIPLPDVSQSIEKRKQSGLGIYFMKKLMDSVDYKRHKGKNRMVLTKNRKKHE